MCYTVCSASFDTVDNLAHLPPPPMGTQSKKAKKRFRKSLKSFMDAIMCRGKPKSDCRCVTVVKEKDEDFVPIDAEGDVPATERTDLAADRLGLAKMSPPKLPDLELELESTPEPTVQLGTSSADFEDKQAFKPRQRPIYANTLGHTLDHAAVSSSADGDDTHDPLAAASKSVPAPRRRALGGSARDEVALARRGQGRVSKKASRDTIRAETKGYISHRVPLVDVTNCNADEGSSATTVETVTKEKIHSETLGAEPTPASRLLVVSTPIVDLPKVAETSPLSLIVGAPAQGEDGPGAPEAALFLADNPHVVPSPVPGPLETTEVRLTVESVPVLEGDDAVTVDAASVPDVRPPIAPSVPTPISTTPSLTETPRSTVEDVSLKRLCSPQDANVSPDDRSPAVSTSIAKPPKLTEDPQPTIEIGVEIQPSGSAATVSVIPAMSEFTQVYNEASSVLSCDKPEVATVQDTLLPVATNHGPDAEDDQSIVISAVTTSLEMTSPLMVSEHAILEGPLETDIPNAVGELVESGIASDTVPLPSSRPLPAPACNMSSMVDVFGKSTTAAELRPIEPLDATTADPSVSPVVEDQVLPMTPKIMLDYRFAAADTAVKSYGWINHVDFFTLAQEKKSRMFVGSLASVSPTLVQESSGHSSVLSSPFPVIFNRKALLEVPSLDLSNESLNVSSSSSAKEYSDACVETRPSLDAIDKDLLPTPGPLRTAALLHVPALPSIVGHILSFVAANSDEKIPPNADVLAAPDLAAVLEVVRPSVVPALPLNGHGSPSMTQAACDDLRQLIQVEREAANTRHAILDTMTRLLIKHEPTSGAPASPPAVSGERQGITAYEDFVQRSLAAEEEWERDMGGIVSALVQLACVPRVASTPRGIASPRPAVPRHPSRDGHNEPTDEEDPLKKIRRELADAAAKKALLFEGERDLRAVEERERRKVESKKCETVKLRATGLLGRDVTRENEAEDEDTISAKKLRYQQYVARKAYEKRIGQMKEQPIPVLKAEGLCVDSRTANLPVQPPLSVPAPSAVHGSLILSTPHKGKGVSHLSPPSSPSSSRSPSRLPVLITSADASPGSRASASPVRVALDKLRPTVSAIASPPSPRCTPGRKPTTAPQKPKPSPKHPVTLNTQQTSSVVRRQASSSSVLDVQTSGSKGKPSTLKRSQMLTPRGSVPPTPCPNPTAHKVVTPKHKPSVAFTTQKQKESTTPDKSRLTVPPNSVRVAITTPRRELQAPSLKATTPTRRTPRMDENATVTLTPRASNISKPAVRHLLRTPLRQIQAQGKSPAKAPFRF